MDEGNKHDMKNQQTFIISPFISSSSPLIFSCTVFLYHDDILSNIIIEVDIKNIYGGLIINSHSLLLYFIFTDVPQLWRNNQPHIHLART